MNMSYIPRILLLLFLLFVTMPTYADPVQVILENGNVWDVEIGQTITVEYENKNKLSSIEGELSRVTDDYIVVGDELIFIDLIVSLIPEIVIPNSTKNDNRKELNDNKPTTTQNTRPIDTPKIVNDKEKIVLIPLEGQVGFLFGGDAIGTTFFTHKIVEELLKTAARANVSKIVFKINSPGGYVYIRDPFCELIQEYRNEFEFIAFVHNAQSAASTITMTCDKIYVAPNSSIGAAVVMSGDTAVDKKFQAADASQVRGYYESANRPGILGDAMSLVESELWFNRETKTFATYAPEENEIWEQVVNSEEILSFDNAQAVKYGIAEKTIDSINEIFLSDEYFILDWSSKIETAMKIATRDVKKIDESWYEIFNVKGIETLADQHNEINSLEWYSDKTLSVIAEIKSKKSKLRKQYYNLNREAKKILKNVKNGKYTFDFVYPVLVSLKACVDKCDRILDLHFGKDFGAVNKLYNQLADDLSAINHSINQ